MRKDYGIVDVWMQHPTPEVHHDHIVVGTAVFGRSRFLQVRFRSVLKICNERRVLC